MTKAERLAYMRQRFPQLKKENPDAGIGFGELPVANHDIQETVSELDTFREEIRDRRSNNTALTTDQ